MQILAFYSDHFSLTPLIYKVCVCVCVDHHYAVSILMSLINGQSWTQNKFQAIVCNRHSFFALPIEFSVLIVSHYQWSSEKLHVNAVLYYFVWIWYAFYCVGHYDVLPLVPGYCVCVCVRTHTRLPRSSSLHVQAVWLVSTHKTKNLTVHWLALLIFIWSKDNLFYWSLKYFTSHLFVNNSHYFNSQQRERESLHIIFLAWSIWAGMSDSQFI